MKIISMLILTILTILTQTALAVEVGQTAQCVVLDHIQNNGQLVEHCIRDHAESQTHTLIEFFSITCSACKENHPIITELGKSLSDVATTRFVSIDRNKNQVIDYVNSRRGDFSFEVALDSERDAKKAYDVNSTPTLFILDKNNTVVYRHSGVLSTEDVLKIKSITRGQ